MPRYLERVLTRLEEGGPPGAARAHQVYEDVALIAQIFARFVADRSDDQRPGLRIAAFHLRKLAFRACSRWSSAGWSPPISPPTSRAASIPFDPADDLSEAGFFYTLESGEPDAVNRCLVRLAERAFYRWLEDVCLDEENGAFEGEDSPFESREARCCGAISRRSGSVRGRDLIPFLRRPGNRDCLRVLGKLEAWFLRQYDVHHAAAMIQHADQTARSRCDGEHACSRATARGTI